MRKRFALAIVIVTSVLLAPAPRANAAPSAASTLEGTWIVDVNVDPSLPIGTFVALETYSRGGGLVTSNDLHRAKGIDVGQGAWNRIGAHAYRASILFFVFEADGVPSGSIEVSHTVQVTAADSYVGEGNATLRATDGSVIASGRFTSFGRKMESEQF